MNNIFTIPFEPIARLLRRLSLSGTAGNRGAILLYSVICLLPIAAFFLLKLKKRANRTDAMLWFISAALFFGIYLLINPGLLITSNMVSVDMVNTAISVTLWSILLCYAVIRILYTINRMNAINLPIIAQVCIILSIAFSVLNVLLIKLPSFIRTLKANIDTDMISAIFSETNAGFPGSGMTSSAWLIFDFIFDLLSTLLFIWVLVVAFQLCRSIKETHFSTETIHAASKLSKTSSAILCITVILEVAKNMIQCLMLSSIANTNFTVSLPIIEILLVTITFIIAKKFETAHAIEEENEAFI